MSKENVNERGGKKKKRNDFKKMIGPGDYFGEVSFLIGCRRTATIKAKLYATLGAVDHKNFTQLLQDYPIFRNHLKNDIVKIYNDDCKLFFMHALRQVDYLADVKDEILVQIAYLCTYRSKEKGSLLYDMEIDPENQINDELVIIFDGAVELYLTMDAGTEFPIDILTTGSILNPHNFLAKRKQATNVRFEKNTIFYFLKYAQLVSVARNYKDFAEILLREKGKAEAMKSRDQNPMDYVAGFQ